MKKTTSSILLLAVTFFGFSQTVSTLAGSDQGYSNGSNLTAQFDSVFDICVDAAGNVFVADQNNTIRKISTDGTTSTFAGNTSAGYIDDIGTNARFFTPNGMCIDAAGTIYVADYNNNKIRKITPNGEVSTFAGTSQGYADGPGATAQFYLPQSVCVDSSGNVYVGDGQNNMIRKITPNGVVSTLAGSTEAGYVDGVGTQAKFNFPQRICVDNNGNVYVSDMFNYCIRKVTPDGTVSTLVGGQLYPQGMCTDTLGNIYIADYYANTINKITPDGVVSTFAGSSQGWQDGAALSAKFNNPTSVCIDATGNLYVTDRENFKIRKIIPAALGNPDNTINTSFSVYPNPAKDVLNVEVNSLIETTQIKITDILGKTVFSKKAEFPKTEINCVSFLRGVYIVTISNGAKIQSKKIILE